MHTSDYIHRIQHDYIHRIQQRIHNLTLYDYCSLAVLLLLLIDLVHLYR